MQQTSYILRSSIYSQVPPLTDPGVVLQRADEVNSAYRMLSDPQTCTLVLTGNSGVGKSTLAALLLRRVEMAVQAGQAPIRHPVWLSLGPNVTVPDVVAAIMREIDPSYSSFPDFITQKPEDQIALLGRALYQTQSSSCVVLDQCEALFGAENSREVVGKGATSLFLNLLQNNPGGSKFVLTSRNSPFKQQNGTETSVRINLVSRISVPEGIALLQQRGVQGSPEELSLIWQRCAGHTYALILFGALVNLSGFSLSYLLNSPDYAPMWSGDVTFNLIGSVINFLNPIQRTILRTLCLFNEPVPVEGVVIATTGLDSATTDIPAFDRELSALTKFSLVQRYAYEKGVSRYFLHQLLRRFLNEHYLEGSDRHSSGDLANELGVSAEPNPMLGNPEARDVALAGGHLRVAAYYSYLAQRQCPPVDQRHGLQDVEPFIAIAYHLCLGWHWRQAYDLLSYEKLGESLVHWGRWNTLIHLYTVIAPPFGVVTRRDEGQILSQLGLLYGRLGDYQSSMLYFEQALLTEREIGDLQGESVTLANQGEILRILGQGQQAYIAFERALQLNSQEYDARLECVVLHNLGLLNQNARNYQQAWNYYRQSLKLAKSLQDQEKSGLILTNMGMLLFDQGQLEESLALLLPALRLRQSLNDRTVNSLVLFLEMLEQTIGHDPFVLLRQEALRRESEVLAKVGA